MGAIEIEEIMKTSFVKKKKNFIYTILKCQFSLALSV
jgi:hypothetical protein